MKDTTSRGDVAELEVAAALVRHGKRLLRPLSSASRYDLLIDKTTGRSLGSNASLAFFGTVACCFVFTA